MGAANKVYEWTHIAPNETVGVWIHGYGTDEFVTYSITAALSSNVPPGAVDVKAQLTIGDTGPHVDGTVGRLLNVTNHSVGPQPYISCQLARFRQTLGT